MSQIVPRAGGVVLAGLFLVAALTQQVYAVGKSGALADADTIIWHARAGAVMDRNALNQAILGADYLILGEVHDNPRHHRLQAELLGAFADSMNGDARAVGFEQLSLDQIPALQAFLQRTDANADALGSAVDWQASGWPDYAIYRPLFEASLQRGLRLVPLMHSAGATREIMTKGSAAVLPAAALDRLRPDTLLDAAQTAVVQQEMQAAHCDKLPVAMLPAMVDVQIARDAFMAHAMVEAASRGVIITGNGHARRDRGIPRFLKRLRPDARIVVVSLLEASQDETPEEQALRQARPGVTDFAIITPAQPREDPCLALQ